MEIFKEMSDSNLMEILNLLNEWFQKENMDKEALKFRVVLIFKKGDTTQ